LGRSAAANAHSPQRRDADFVIIARTDAKASEGMEAAIERAQAYVEAGADMIFPEALESPDEFGRFASAMRVPLLANMTEFGKSPLLTASELGKLGYAAVLFPVTLLRVAAKAVEDALAELARDGSQKNFVDRMQTRAQLYELLDYTGFESRDRSYFGSR
jgi:methylisocitrate lyase